MDNPSCNPYLPTIVDEIRSSPVYLRFLQLLRDFNINRIIDCHAHISSGQLETIAGAPSDLVPQHPFTIADVNYLYRRLFLNEGMRFSSVVFDTPLPVYDLANKNDQLLRYWQEMDPADRAEILPFAVVTPDMDLKQILRWVEKGARGFKMTPRTTSTHVKRGVIADVTLSEMLSPEALWVADQSGLPLIIHLPQLVVSPRIRQSLKDELLLLAARYSRIKLVLAHLGQAQTAAKMEDLLNLIQGNGLTDIIWMDISAVTVPSVLAMALESDVRLMFGSDIDFALVERGRYVTFKVIDGKRVLASGDDNGNLITALVSQNFGMQLRHFVVEAGIDLNAPLMVFQFEGIIDAVERLRARGIQGETIKAKLQNLLSGNALSLFNNY